MPETPVKKLLFISPILPSATGSGLAMRAFRAVEAFAQQYQIYLLVPDFGYNKQTLDQSLLSLTANIEHLQLNQLRDVRSFIESAVYRFWPRLYYRLFSQPLEWRLISNRSIKQISQLYQQIDFDLIHIFRFYMIRFAQPFIERSPNTPTQLDVDDIESLTRYRISNLHRSNGDESRAINLNLDGKQYQQLERDYLPRFTQLLVCSDRDREWIMEKYQCRNVAVIPNTVGLIPAATTTNSNDSDCFILLFIGTLSYYPNQDALDYFCREVLPLVRVQTERRFELRVVGRDLPVPLAETIKQHSEVRLMGWVADLSQQYQQADVVIAPIRAGGGTRIKILEAFAYQNAVITTTMGVEGIRAEHGRDLIIADTPETFADAIIELMNNSELCLRLVENGYRLLNQSYHPDQIRAELLRLLDNQ